MLSVRSSVRSSVLQEKKIKIRIDIPHGTSNRRASFHWKILKANVTRRKTSRNGHISGEHGILPSASRYRGLLLRPWPIVSSHGRRHRQAPIVLRYSAHIKPRKRLKPLNQTTFTHKHIMTLTVSSKSIAVNK